ncbi:MAG: tRNA-dihydrouridine synthase [Candidatus Doudnabacteria bacterium]|nr:tRNA-dihydrouridine synthase [Candidatus Doudnabacteria bacterium]
MFETTLMGLQFEHPVFNAPGEVKRLEHVKALCSSAAVAIMVGSITWEQRDGNAGNVYYPGPEFSLNSLGLPNGGREYYRKHLPDMVRMAHDAGKPLFVSVAGFSPHEYLRLADLVAEAGADAVELNLGCPNVWDGGQQKGILSFEPDRIDETLGLLKFELDLPVSLKLSPYSDPGMIPRIAEVLKRHADMVKAISAVNCFPNALKFGDDGQPVITPGQGLAGLGGPAMRPIALGQVFQWFKVLPTRYIQIIRVGGASHGKDVFESESLGATATQVGTAFFNEGPGIFSRILAEMVELQSKAPNYGTVELG